MLTTSDFGARDWHVRRLGLDVYVGISVCILFVDILGILVNDIVVTQACVIFTFAGNLVIVAMDGLRLWRDGRGAARFVVLAGTFFWFLFDAIALATHNPPFEPRYGMYPGFSATIPVEIVSFGLVCVQLFMLALLLAIRYGPVPLGSLRTMALRKDRFSSAGMDWACLCLAMLGYAPLLISSQGDPTELVVRLLLMRNQDGELTTASGDSGLYRHLLYFGIFGAAIAVARVLAGVSGSWWPRILAIILSAFWVLLSGTRFQTTFLFLPGILVLVSGCCGSTRLEQRRMRVRAAALLGIVATTFWLQAALRDTGVEGLDRYESTIELIEGGATGHEHFEALLIAIDLAERRGEYFMEWMLPVVVTHLVPRAWWEGKPDWESWQFYNDQVTGGLGSTNVTPSVIGQYYLNWGLYGVVLVGLMFGWLARFLDGWLALPPNKNFLTSATFATLLIAFLFVSFRIFSGLYIAYMLAAALAYPVITRRVAA